MGLSGQETNKQSLTTVYFFPWLSLGGYSFLLIVSVFCLSLRNLFSPIVYVFLDFFVKSIHLVLKDLCYIVVFGDFY